MLTLKELRNMVMVAHEERVPSAKNLEANYEIVVKEALSNNTSIAVYENGYVLYRAGNRETVFELHNLEKYTYDSVMEDREEIPADFFDNENWYVRLILEAEDLMDRNQRRRISNQNICSYSFSWDCSIIVEDKGASALEQMVEQDKLEELMAVLTENQKSLVLAYYIEEYSQKEIAQSLGVSQQYVAKSIKTALEVMKNAKK